MKNSEDKETLDKSDKNIKKQNSVNGILRYFRKNDMRRRRRKKKRIIFGGGEDFFAICRRNEQISERACIA